MTPWTSRRKRKREEVEVNVDVWEKIMIMIAGLEDILNLSYSCKGMRNLFERAIRGRWKRAMRSLATGERYDPIDDFRMPFYRIVSYFHLGMKIIRKGINVEAWLAYAEVLGSIERARSVDPPVGILETSARDEFIGLGLRDDVTQCYSDTWIRSIGYNLWGSLDALCVMCERLILRGDVRLVSGVENIADTTLWFFMEIIDTYLTSHVNTQVSDILAWVKVTLRDMRRSGELFWHADAMLARALLAEYDIWLVLVRPLDSSVIPK